MTVRGGLQFFVDLPFNIIRGRLLLLLLLCVCVCVCVCVCRFHRWSIIHVII